MRKDLLVYVRSVQYNHKQMPRLLGLLLEYANRCAVSILSGSHG
jgi:hypothetical protein